MLIQHVAPGDVFFAAISALFLGRGVYFVRRRSTSGGLCRAESVSTEFIRVHGVAIDGYSVEVRFPHSMRLLAQLAMVRYTIVVLGV